MEPRSTRNKRKKENQSSVYSVCSVVYSYPSSAKVNRVVPKTRIYEKANASAKLRQLFVDQVDQIVWQYKLAPETINLDATKSVAEIQVFTITLRVANINEDVLRAIDKAIPYPIIFGLLHNGKQKVIAAYKRPSEADSSKWVVSEYFSTEWEAEDKPRKPLPQALDLGRLYDGLLDALIPAYAVDETIAERVERTEAIRAKQREAERIKARLTREKQFNKRITINAELRKITQELERLM